jgi:hypothetical protein
LLLDARVSGLVGFDDFVAPPVQTASEDQVVEGVGCQVLDQPDPKVFKFTDVLPIIIFPSLSYRRRIKKCLKY